MQTSHQDSTKGYQHMNRSTKFSKKKRMQIPAPAHSLLSALRAPTSFLFSALHREYVEKSSPLVPSRGNSIANPSRLCRIICGASERGERGREKGTAAGVRAYRSKRPRLAICHMLSNLLRAPDGAQAMRAHRRPAARERLCQTRSYRVRAIFRNKQLPHLQCTSCPTACCSPRLCRRGAAGVHLLGRHILLGQTTQQASVQVCRMGFAGPLIRVLRCGRVCYDH